MAGDSVLSQTTQSVKEEKKTFEKKLKVGIIGTGWIAGNHVREYLKMPDVELERIGARVGSDVPFCVHGGTALAEGRGERLTDLAPMPACSMVICKPDFGLSTPQLFGRVRVDDIARRPDHGAMKAALAAGDLSGVADALCNVFCEVLAEKERHEILHIRQVMLENGALNAVMTGSGPTVFGVFDDEDAAQKAAAILSGKYADTYTVQPV